MTARFETIEPPEALGLPSLDDQPGPARRIGAGKAASMVSAAMAAALEGDAADALAAAAAAERAARDADPTMVAVIEPRRGRRLRAMLVAASLLVIGGVASAGIGVYTWIAASAVEVAGTPPPAREPARAAAPPAAQEAEPDAGGVELDLGLVVESPERTRTRAREPDDLLERANERRKARRWREAERLYRMVMSEHQRSDAAYVAMVASASIRLDHLRDAPGALTLYRRALLGRPDGALAEEARFGVAAAQRALGDLAAETEALERFLARHPQSPLADRARARLETLAP